MRDYEKRRDEYGSSDDESEDEQGDAVPSDLLDPSPIAKQRTETPISIDMKEIDDVAQGRQTKTKFSQEVETISRQKSERSSSSLSRSVTLNSNHPLQRKKTKKPLAQAQLLIEKLNQMHADLKYKVDCAFISSDSRIEALETNLSKLMPKKKVDSKGQE